MDDASGPGTPRYQEIVPLKDRVLKRYDLCDHCLGRMFARRIGLSSHRRLGGRLNGRRSGKCYICHDLFEGIGRISGMMLDGSSGYEFETFGVGSMLKPSMIDRDDLVRSRFKLVGADSIRSGVTRELARSFARKTRKRLGMQDPDIIITVDLREESCRIRTKHLTVYGRYVKESRGLPQKQDPCGNCGGRGCMECDLHGMGGTDSVEGRISTHLFGMIGGTTARFTWIGGEDQSSMVLGNGRPFFARIKNPKKRALEGSSACLDGVRVSGMRIVDDPPRVPLKFRSCVRLDVRTEGAVDPGLLRRLGRIRNNLVAVYDRTGRRSEKRILSLRYRRAGDRLRLLVESEGGLPLKRFVSGDDVTPSVSSMLDVPCTCLAFDITGVHLEEDPDGA